MDAPHKRDAQFPTPLNDKNKFSVSPLEAAEQ
jgi:hypothetical protein